MSVVAVALSATAVASASKPVRTPVPPADSILPASFTGCGFAVEANTVISTAQTISFYDNGTLERVLFVGHSVTTYTNVKTGASITLNTSGPGKFTFYADGSIDVVAPGPQGAVPYHGDLLYIRGHLEYSFGPSGDLTSLSYVGNEQSLCEALAG